MRKNIMYRKGADMIVQKSLRGKSTKLCQRKASIYTQDGKVCLSLQHYNCNRLDFEAVIEPVELRAVRDACNRALGEITGFEYTTQVRVNK